MKELRNCDIFMLWTCKTKPIVAALLEQGSLT